jgi:hypothetical protein
MIDDHDLLTTMIQFTGATSCRHHIKMKWVARVAITMHYYSQTLILIHFYYNKTIYFTIIGGAGQSTDRST